MFITFFFDMILDFGPRSGMNGSGTRTQRAKGINDSPEIFMADTIRGGANNEKHAAGGRH